MYDIIEKWEKRKMTNKTYRQERKSLLTKAKAVLLEQRIAAVLPLDDHASQDGTYRIRSIYFDTVANSAYQEKNMGISDREKIRLRFYGVNPSTVKLEKKEKRENLIHKEVILINRETAEAMMKGDFTMLLYYDAPLAKEVYAKAMATGLVPVVVVDYLRKAYVYPTASVRITFDYELSAEITSENMWTPNECYDVIGNNVILEVKFNKYLPTHIKELVSSVPGAKIALSKYVMCRDSLREKHGYLVGGKV